MGCDIHLMLESKGIKDGKDKWYNIDHYKPNRYYSDYPDEESKMNRVEFYNGRNYTLFAVLADVRNREDTKVIDTPRGIPQDCSSQVKLNVDSWEDDAHSHSWFTYGELLTHYRKYPREEVGGLMSQESADLFDEKGITPNTWCQGSSDGSMVRRTWYLDSPLKSFIDDLEKRLKMDYCQYNWSDDQDVESLKKLEDTIRVIFWFDN